MYTHFSTALLLAATIIAPSNVASYDLNLDDKGGIKSIAKDIATDLMDLYPGNKVGGTPGDLVLPYYWWEAGALMGTMIDYWYYTGDSTWNQDVEDGMLFQVGQYEDFMPANQTHTEGNDDQGFWGLAAMSAAEFNFPNPPSDKPQWLALAQAVFNTQAARWDAANCGGGLRWQIFTWNNGYDYKNTISQACFFSLGARLALYTGNTSYSDWATKSYEWTSERGYINDQFQVFDGAYVQDGCQTITRNQWTYNVGGFILGTSAMYNFTGDQVWKDRLDGLLAGAKVFFSGPEKNIMTEAACEPTNICNVDQHSFKAYLSRWMAVAMQWAPHTQDTIMPLLRASSQAAAAQCTGGSNGRLCGLKWTDNKWDGSSGIGQQMAALEVILSNLIPESGIPKTSDTGGTSPGDSGAGGSDIGRQSIFVHSPATPGGRAGAAILTLCILLGLMGGVSFLLHDECSKASPRQQWADLRQAYALGGLVGILRRQPSNSDDINNVQKRERYHTAGTDSIPLSDLSGTPTSSQPPIPGPASVPFHSRRHSLLRKTLGRRI